MGKPIKFRKRPVDILAMRFDGGMDSARDIISWMSPTTGIYHEKWDRETVQPPERLTIDTLEGQMAADVGDWVIRGIKGEFYPCKPDIFDATYDQVADRSF